MKATEKKEMNKGGSAGDSGAKAISEALKINRTLTALNLDREELIN